MARALRIGAGLVLAFVVLTCTDGQVAGPNGPGALRLDLSALTGPAASGEPDIPLDSIRVIFRPAGQSAIAYDTTIAPVAGLPGGSLSFSLTSSNVAAATLVNSAGGTGSPQTVQISSGQSNSPTTVGAGGAAVRCVAPGTSSISGTASGLITTCQGTRSVTVQ